MLFRAVVLFPKIVAEIVALHAVDGGFAVARVFAHEAAGRGRLEDFPIALAQRDRWAETPKPRLVRRAGASPMAKSPAMHCAKGRAGFIGRADGALLGSPATTQPLGRRNR